MATPMGIYYTVGTFFPCDLSTAGECETSHSILEEVRRIPDASSVEGGMARLHWRFKNPVEAQGFWRRAYAKFPALPWNILHNPSWAAQTAVPDELPAEDL